MRMQVLRLGRRGGLAQDDSSKPRSQVSKSRPGSTSSHPSHKDNRVARVGHPLSGLGLRGLRLMVVVRAALSKHLLKLLLLLIIQDSFDLRVRILPDGPRLGVAILHAERSVGAQSLHLLLASGEDGRDLRHLIAREAQALAEMRGELVGARSCGAGSLAALAWLAVRWQRGPGWSQAPERT